MIQWEVTRSGDWAGDMKDGSGTSRVPKSILDGNELEIPVQPISTFGT